MHFKLPIDVASFSRDNAARIVLGSTVNSERHLQDSELCSDPQNKLTGPKRPSATYQTAKNCNAENGLRARELPPLNGGALHLRSTLRMPPRSRSRLDLDPSSGASDSYALTPFHLIGVTHIGKTNAIGSGAEQGCNAAPRIEMALGNRDMSEPGLLSASLVGGVHEAAVYRASPSIQMPRGFRGCDPV